MSEEMQSRTDVGKFQNGVRKAENFIVRVQGGLAFRGGLRQVCEVEDSAHRGWLGEFNLDLAESYVLLFGENTLRFVRDGALVLDSDRDHNDFTVSTAVPAVFSRATAHGYADGERVFVIDADAPYLTRDFYTVAGATATTFTLVDRWGGAVTVDDALTGVRIAPVYQITTPYSCACARGLSYSQDQNRLYLYSLDHTPHVLTRVAPDVWTLVAETFVPSIVPPLSVTSAATEGTGAVDYTYVVATIDEQTGEESLPSLPTTVANDLSIAGNKNTVSWAAVAGAARYVVYKDENGIYGFIGGTEALSFVDENVTADVSDTPQKLRNPFDGEGNYPGVGGFFEQRHWFARTKNNPGGVWASQTTSIRNMNVSSPLKDTDAITFRLRGTRSAEVVALVPTDNLLLLTTSGEWLIRGGDVDEPLTPLNIKTRQRAFRGSEHLRPLLVGDLVLHVERGGGAIRDFRLDREVASTDLTLLAKHLLRRRTVVSWAYSQQPYGVVFAVLDDGSLLSMTYQLEHEVWAWTRHRIGGDGFVESVACVMEGGTDAVYLQVRYTINEQTKRYIERLDMLEPVVSEEAFHVDAGVTYDGVPASLIYGFGHLEGETLVALADGNVVRDLTVVDGAIELPNPASVVHAGLPYVGRIETLDLDLGPMRDIGSIMGRMKAVAEIRLRVVRSRALWAGVATGGLLAEFKQRQNEDWGAPIALFTGDVVITPYGEWGTGGSVVIEQRDPLPAYVAGMAFDWDFGE